MGKSTRSEKTEKRGKNAVLFRDCGNIFRFDSVSY